MPSPPPFTIKSQPEIRDDILRTWRNGLIKRGVANPNVSPGSDYYVLATGIANEIAVVEANGGVAIDANMPDSAVGDNLRRWLQLFGGDFRPAGGSAGFVVLSSSSASTVSSGSQLLDGAGLRYQVTQTATYANAALIPVSAVDVGAASNHAAGDVLTWVSPPPFSDPTAVVASLGLTGGSDAEKDEPARSRLLSLFQNPPSSGNWQDVCNFAEASTPAVEKCFVYPAAEGPGSLHYAVTIAATTTAATGARAATRQIDATTLANVVAPYVLGLYPEHAGITATGVTNVSTDVSIALSLPSAPQATPAGPGGGWLDGTPWPTNVNADAAFKCTVTAVTSTSVFTVDAPSAPTPNATRIAYLSPTDWTLRTAKVIAVSGSAGAYQITIDTPFVGIANGNFIWPQCQNQQTYVTALLQSFAKMGPGEKTTSVSVLIRGFRHPTSQLSWPYALGAQQLRALTDAGTEVFGASWLYRSTTTPAVPGTISSAPNILIPNNIGLYSA